MFFMSYPHADRHMLATWSCLTAAGNRWEEEKGMWKMDGGREEKDLLSHRGRERERGYEVESN